LICEYCNVDTRNRGEKKEVYGPGSQEAVRQAEGERQEREERDGFNFVTNNTVNCVRATSLLPHDVCNKKTERRVEKSYLRHISKPSIFSLGDGKRYLPS
jgi:hypothetical protein